MKQPETDKYLKNLKNGRVFIYTELLAKSESMVVCDVNGNISEGHYAEASEDGVIERAKSNYLGNPVNGVLYPYTGILAQRDDFVSINDPEEWRRFMAERDGNAKIEVLPGGKEPSEPADTPTLGRSGPTIEEIVETKQILDDAGDVSHETPRQGVGLPNTEGMGAREAKTLLSEWAEKKFGHKLDRRPSLDTVIAEAQSLLDRGAAAAG